MPSDVYPHIMHSLYSIPIPHFLPKDHLFGTSSSLRIGEACTHQDGMSNTLVPHRLDPLELSVGLLA